MNNLRSTFAIVWRIAVPYFRSEDKWAGRGLLAAVIAIELALVGIDVLINQWQNRFFNALQERNWDSFVREIGIFTILAFCAIGLAVYQLYLNQWLQIRWRRWMTTKYLGEWLHDANHYRMQLQGDAADNPDQRITDDVKLFVERTLDIGVADGFSRLREHRPHGRQEYQSGEPAALDKSVLHLRNRHSSSFS